MHNYHRLPTLALSVVLLLVFIPSPGASAAAPAAFTTPASGIITVLQGTSYQASWVETSGVTITSQQIALQTARPMGARGCDDRWTPALVATVEGTSFTATNLAADRCYRFVLALQTPAGRQLVASAPIISAPEGLGATAQFTNPFVDGTVVYEPKTTVGWAKWDTFGLTIVSQRLYVQTASVAAGSCAGVTWSSWTQLSYTGQSIGQTLSAGRCYRYRLVVQDSLGYRSEIVSGSISRATALPAWTGSLDLYRPETFSSQIDKTVCIAASTQMMLNMILNQTDTSADSQLRYIAYAQANDAGSYTNGSDPQGWAAALNRYGGAGYSIGLYRDFTSALKAAVTRMRKSNKPVGMLVEAGRHAWVMSGFTATADPALTSNFIVTSVFVEGPLYPRPLNPSGYDLPPDTPLTPTRLAQYFTKYDDGHWTWNGYYVLIIP